MIRKLPTLSEILEKRQLPGLDGFRMVAVASVVLYHAGIGSSFFSARHGVAGFFVLSGFLITWLLLKEQKLTGAISLRDFYIRRSLRIFPAYYVFVIVTIVVDLFRGIEEIRDAILPSFLYYMNYYNALENHPSTSVAHLWSLAVEEQFYLTWPIILVLLLKHGKESVIRFLILVISAVLIWRSIAVTVINLGQSWAYNSFDTRLDNLAIGCLIAMLIEKKRIQRFLELISSRFWMPIITLVLLWLSGSIQNYHYEYGPAFTLDALLLGILLIQLMVLSHGKVFAWLNFRPVVYFGLISYPIYLWHLRGLEAGNKLTMLPEPIRLVSGILIGIILAVMSYHILEKPFLRLKQKYKHY